MAWLPERKVKHYVDVIARSSASLAAAAEF